MATRLLLFVTGVLCVATLLGFGGRWSWVCELLVNFRTQYVLGLAAMLLLALALRRWAVAVLVLLAMAVNLWAMRGLFADDPAPLADARPLRLVALNVWVRNPDVAGAATWLASQSPDVVVLEEVTAASAARLADSLPLLAHRRVAVQPGRRGVAVFSRWPIVAAENLALDGQLFGVRAALDLGERQLRLFGMHLDWPMFPVAARGRDAQLRALGAELADCTGACVVAGDFNTTPWSSHFRELLETSGFRDAASKRGWLGTWPVALPAPLGIRIDHCLVSQAVGVAGVHDGGNTGSDHRALICELRVPAPTKTPP